MELRAHPGRRLNIRTVARRKDGTTYPIELRIELVPTRGREIVLVVATDLTETERAQERINLLSAAIEAAQDPIILAKPGAQPGDPATIVYIHPPDLVEHHGLGPLRVEAARPGPDQGEGDGHEVVVEGQLDRILDRFPDRPLGRPPEQVDPGDVDDRLERQAPRRCQDGPAQRDRPVPAKFTERSGAAPPLDRPGDALGEEQPPRDDVAVPRVDDHFDRLDEQIPLDDADIHGGSLRARGRNDCS